MSTPASVLHDTRRRLLTRLISLFATLFIFSVAHAQTQPTYFILGEKEFDGAQIYDVIQDDALNYWIATDNGIYKYDSYAFTKVECEGAQSLAVFGFIKNLTGVIYCYNLNNQILQIRNGICSVLYELKADERAADIYLSITPENELLIFAKTVLHFSENGLQLKTDQPQVRYYGFPFLTASNKTISHIIDSDSLLICTQHVFSYVKMNTNGSKLHGVLKFFTLNDHTYAISTFTKEIFLFDEKDFSLVLMPSTELDHDNESYRIYNENNQVWAAGVISGVRIMSENYGLSLSENYYTQYLISDVYKDAEGNILLSTFNHGILVVPDVAIPGVLTIPGNQSITSIQSDSELGLLMGTLTGDLLAYKNGAYTTLSESGSRPLQSLFSWDKFPFIIFDDGNIRALNKSTTESTNLAQGSLKDAVLVSDSVFYLAMNIGLARVKWKGGIDFEYQKVPEITIRCYSVEYSALDKRLYVATSDGVKIIGPDGEVTQLLYNSDPVFANDIHYADGVVYLGMKEGILKCINGAVVSSIATIIQGKNVEVLKLHIRAQQISVITTRGFAMFDTDGKLFMQLNTKQGFSTNRIYDFDNVGEEIWICHSKGVQLLNSAVLNQPVAKPLLSIAALTVNDNNVAALSAFGSFKSDERKFRFILSSPTLRNSENIRYHYQLSGYDESWFVADYIDNEIIYNALAPGDYIFTVKAENTGVFSDPVSYSFTITAPFYTRWWFMAIIGILLLLVITAVYRYRLLLQERKSKLENELHASRLTAIQSQMNPHFIFNALNSIQDLVLKGDVDNSYTFITKFSNLVRRTLNYSDKDFIEFEQEIKLIELYLSLEKLRFKDELEFTIDTGNVEDILIPPMLIQPFIENALVHGLLHKEGKKHIVIRFHVNDTLTCTIEDNGVGRAKAKEIKERQRLEHESFSSQAIRKRFHILSEVFKNDFGFAYTDMHENGQATGTRVRLSIPVKHRF